MEFRSRGVWLGAVSAALVVAGCGGSAAETDRSTSATDSPSPGSVVERSQLTGLEFDVRRDPG